MNISIIGTGYVGLVTGVVLADLGNDVICIDSNYKKIEGLRRGIMPIYEPGLQELVARNIAEGRLSFSTNTEESVSRSKIVFIAVGTPPRPDGSTDLTYIEAAAIAIARGLNGYKVIVNKSTVPVGTGQFVSNVISNNRQADVDFDVVSNPEFLREGSAIQDSLAPDRIVIGAPSREAAMPLVELYAPLERPMIVTDVCSAEMIKYAANAFLATKISFANAVANLCDAVGADISQVVKGMGLDTRIGPAFLSAGIGYGGSCFPKDTRSLLSTAQQYGCDFPLLGATITTNDEQPLKFLAKIRRILGADMSGKVVGVLGLAFKPNTDDMRDAKSVDIVHGLVDAGAAVQAFDPIAMENAHAMMPPSVRYVANAYEAAQGADALVVVTEWNEFRQLSFEHLYRVMRNPLIFDGRNIYNPEYVQRQGFEYHSVGRPSRVPIADFKGKQWEADMPTERELRPPVVTR